jgi:CRISPR system Cascade subunit CasD
MNSLILRLAAPMQSWGTQSRFSVRDTGREPSKSGVVGLLAAALGRARSEDVSDLMQLRMAVRIDRDGSLSRDYQTAGGGRLPGGGDYGVAKANQAKPATVTSSRYYLADADFRVALEGEDVGQLRLLAAALAEPRWPLYLGRKAFVPNHPLCRGIRLGVPMFDALQREPWFYRSAREKPTEGEPLSLRAVVEAVEPGDSDGVRTDTTDSFASRDFRLRHITTKWIELPPDLIQEECHVPLAVDS